MKNILSSFGCRILALFIALIGIVGCGNNIFASEFKNETLNYVVTYKWGLIQKDAGDCRLTLRNVGNNYEILLTARSKPWADKIYSVRDTLRASIRKNPFRPLRYSKTAHERGNYKQDIISFSYSGRKVQATAVRKKIKKGKVTDSRKSFTANGEAFDFISIFYYLRSLDYNSLHSGTMIRKTIFSGSKSETITIKFLGKQTITLRNKKKALTWHISFRFTSEGGKKSSDDINVWMSTDSSHIPLLLEGSLPVGKVRCVYIG